MMRGHYPCRRAPSAPRTRVLLTSPGMHVRTVAPTPPRARRVRASWWSLLVLLFAAAPRLWAALWDGGVFWPDEIYQTLEPAHHFAFGWGLMTRELREGSRSWLLPGLIGLAWKGAALVGVHSSETLVSIA